MKLEKCDQQSVLVSEAKCRQSSKCLIAFLVQLMRLSYQHMSWLHTPSIADRCSVHNNLCLTHCRAKCKTVHSALTSSSACSELSRLRLKLSSLATSLFSFLTVLMSAAFSLPSRCACSSDVLAYIKQQESMLTIARGTPLRCQNSLACTSSQATIK